jgi:putative transposase
MANTYTQIYIHVVFVVRGRASLISERWKEDLYKYITGIIKNKEQKLMIINGMPDHLHLLLGLRPDNNLSELARDIKANSSRWINERKLVTGKFEWQTGFGAFSVSTSQIGRVIEYIRTQEEHHRIKNFREEYVQFLKENDIEFNERFLPEEVGDR